MAKRLTTEDHLGLLRSLRTVSNEARMAGLGELLARPNLHGIVIKMAAALALESDATSLALALIGAARSLMDPATAGKRDPGCEAKTAIAKALVTWETPDADFFLELARYHQFEPTFGEPVDSAAECRGLAAIAIARLRPSNAVFLLTELLTDARKETRASAAIALGLWPAVEAAALLHLKARLGDEDAEVMGEVYAALLRFDDPQYFDLIAAQLESDDERIIEAAALALGQSKLPGALAPLTRAWERHRRSRVASTLLMSIAFLRNEQSIDWLLQHLPKEGKRDALSILDALGIYRSDERIRARLVPLVAEDIELREAFARTFGA